MIYLSLHCHQRNDSCIKMGSDKSHFNVSLIVRDKVKPDSVHRPQLLKRKERGSGIEQGKTGSHYHWVVPWTSIIQTGP